jgi:peptidoglycan/xylan/chitin deacetylase (PgdA/CDA1 family)
MFLYCVLPYLLTLLFGYGVFKKGRSKKLVSFTFDDGPHPDYTPQLLDLLKKHNVKGSFFVLGSKAEQYPELISRMHQEGHLIGIHNYKHYSNILMTPRQVRRQVNQSTDIVERITKVRPIFYRPPWGLLNLFDFFILRNFHIVLWSVMAEDWKNRGGSLKIKKKILRKLQGGNIYLLHDSGDTWGADPDAPVNTLHALEEILDQVKRRGYTCVRVDRLLNNYSE